MLYKKNNDIARVSESSLQRGGGLCLTSSHQHWSKPANSGGNIHSFMTISITNFRLDHSSLSI